MAEYEDGDSGQVMHESYCLKKSIEARNVDSMNKAYGYNNLADLANTPPPPTQMKGEKKNIQLGPQLPAPSKNGRNE